MLEKEFLIRRKLTTKKGPFSVVVQNEYLRRKFVASVVEFLLQNGFDGFGLKKLFFLIYFFSIVNLFLFSK